MSQHVSRLALAAAIALVLGACSSDPNRLPPDNPFKGGKSERELRLEADGLYRLARRSLDSADFQSALQRYGAITMRFPFTDYATQAQLETIYAKYRSFDPDGALAAADRFLKEHPRHAAVDYVQYLKGVINFQRGDSLFDGIIDSSGHDVGAARKAFDDFSLLTQKHPNSRYAGDARLRMVYLRNRIAAHELSIVKYYVRRGAHVAAARRAERIIADYPGAPAAAEALVLLERSYRELELVAQADEVQRLIAANPQVAAALPPKRFERAVDPIPPPLPAGAADAFAVQPGATVREVTTQPRPLPPPPEREAADE